MCGQVGFIFGRKRRRRAEWGLHAETFVRLMLESEARGPHATGVAWIKQGGEYGIYKRPGRAQEIVFREAFAEQLETLDMNTTVLMGHTRYRTRGSEKNNRNNHPLRTGGVIGTHNGTIYNADFLFKMFKLNRFAEVDSELLFRLADRALHEDGINLDRFLRAVAHCRGQISAVMASAEHPEAIHVLKGNKPLSLRYNRRFKCIAYASANEWLDRSLEGQKGWRSFDLDPMTLAVFNPADLLNPILHNLQFTTQEHRTMIVCKGADHDE